MSKQFNHLNIPSHWQSYWTRFPEGHTILEALIQWVSQVDEMVDNQNKLSDTVSNYGTRLDQFIDQFDGHLSDEVKDTLGEWQQSGFLDIVIDQALETKFHEMDNRLTTQLAQTNQDILQRGVNVLNPPEGYTPCVGDGVVDDTEALQQIINNFNIVILPINHVYRVTDTIYLGQRRKSLIAVVPPSGSGENVAKILYDGEENRKKAVVVIGTNDVGAEPTVDASGLVFKNIIVDGNHKAGFGVYGTYLTNETTIDGVMTIHTLEYGQYYARAWYARFANLTSKNNWGKGLVFGIPILYQSGEEVKWTTLNALELNNTPIQNIRAHNNGRFYSVTNPNIFDITNEQHRYQGYGIGFGLGNGFNVDTFTSELNGGVNLYVYSHADPMKHINNGYLENAMYNSGVPNEQKTNMLIHHAHSSGGTYTIENILMVINSGGIHFTGESRKVLLKNVHQPRFLSSLDAHSLIELYSIVLKDNVYYQAGQYNTDEVMALSTHYEMGVNVRYSFNFQVTRATGGAQLVYARLSSKNTSENQPNSSLAVRNLENNTTQSYRYPELTNEWQLVRRGIGDYSQFEMGGLGGALDTEIDLKIVTMPYTGQ